MLKTPSRGDNVIAFIHEFCMVPEGKLVGKPIKLAEFQKKFIHAIYDNKDAQTRQAYLSIARKNGKTALIACLMLAHLIGPEAVQNSQVVSGALKRDQAAIVFDLAVKIVMQSPVLAGNINIVPSGKRMIGLPMNVEYKALSADGKTAHGLSPVLAILDEIGQIEGTSGRHVNFVDAITTGQGAHENPLLVVISTQAPTDADLFSVMIDDAEVSKDPAIVSHVYTAKEDCDVTDEKAWQDANPALGIFRSLDDIKEKSKQAARMPTTEAMFRVLFLNQRVNMTSPFVTAAIWKRGNDAISPFTGSVYGGLDLSATTDLTSLVLTNRQNGILHVMPFFWMPHDSVRDAAKRDRAPYDLWVKQGLIRTTPGKVIDYAFVARDIGEICAGLDVVNIGFDRWRMDRLQAQLDAAGVDLPLEPFGQGYVSMSPALDALEADLLKETILHGGNAPLAMCAANAVAIPDPAGNRKLDKSKATGRIDGMVALAMACGVESMNAEVEVLTPWDLDPEFSLAAL